RSRRSGVRSRRSGVRRRRSGVRRRRSPGGRRRRGRAGARSAARRPCGGSRGPCWAVPPAGRLPGGRRHRGGRRQPRPGRPRPTQPGGPAGRRAADLRRSAGRVTTARPARLGARRRCRRRRERDRRAPAGRTGRPQHRRSRRPRLAARGRSRHRPGDPRRAGPAGWVPLDARPAAGARHRRRPLRPVEGPRPGVTVTVPALPAADPPARPPAPDAPSTLLRAQFGAVLAAAAVVAGARAGEYAPWLAGGVPAAGLVGALVGAGLGAGVRAGSGGRRRPVPRRLAKAAGVVGLAALAAASMARAIGGLGRLPAHLAAAGVEGRVTVRLAADPGARWAEVRVPARLESVVGRRAGPVSGAGGHPPAIGSDVVVGRARGTVLVVAKGAAAERLRLLEAGESAALVGWFRAPAAGERRWRWRHAGAVFEADDLVGSGRAAPALLRVANGVRHRVLAGGAGLSDTDRALVAGFLVGDDRALPSSVAADFRAAGLSHLLVVSGANVTLALALVSPVLRRLGLLGRLTGGLAVLVVFCAMARFEPSVLRAGAMAGLALLAAFLGRPAPGLRLLALTVCGLILVDPFLTPSVGFGLSCGASAGILLFSGAAA